MRQPGINSPRKTRELHNHHFDSTVWNDFEFRDDEIVAELGEGCARWLASGE